MGGDLELGRGSECEREWACSRLACVVSYRIASSDAQRGRSNAYRGSVVSCRAVSVANKSIAAAVPVSVLCLRLQLHLLVLRCAALRLLGPLQCGALGLEKVCDRSIQWMSSLGGGASPITPGHARLNRGPAPMRDLSSQCMQPLWPLHFGGGSRPLPSWAPRCRLQDPGRGCKCGVHWYKPWNIQDL